MVWTMRRTGFLIILLLFCGPLRAQTGTPSPTFPLSPGSSVEGNLNDSLFSVRYSFEAQAGDVITLQMQPTSGNLDPYLLLFSPVGDLLEQNDDDATGSRAARIDYTAEQAGTYVVEATRFQQQTGPSSGTYRLILEIAGAGPDQTTADPLSIPPSFGVPFNYIEYQEFQAGSLNETSARRYFAVGGQQGDLVRVVMTATSGDLVPQVTIRNKDLTAISRETQGGASETIVFATLPEAGWYLIEAGARSGTGSFGIYVDRRAVAVLEIGQTVQAEFTPAVDTLSYIINGHIGDQVIVTFLSAEGATNLRPEMTLLDLSLRAIATSRLAEETATLVRAFIGRTPLPRSGAYILQVRNLRPEVTGRFNLRLSGIPVDIEKLSAEIAIPAAYNNLYKGLIDDSNPVAYYQFSGKAGELVTIQMNATDGSLDPYVILANAQLDELAFNDNIGISRNARLTQYALPQDGEYFILATRRSLASGNTSGLYDLALTVGQISLLPGQVTATLNWNSDADLNLLIRDPQGRIISWSRPQLPSGGTLQIDSNTRCQTPSAQPVEHIYWPSGAALPTGEYTLWVWYQQVCSQPTPVTFALQVAFEGEVRLDIRPETFRLQPDQRFEAAFFITASGLVVTGGGQVTNTSPQQRASEGGDTLILYGQDLIGTISDQAYALFYQFNAQAGDQIIASAQTVTGTLDPILVLRDDADNNLAINDDQDARTRNARLTYTIPADGLYVIAVTRYGLRDGTTTGDFRLTLEKAN